MPEITKVQLLQGTGDGDVFSMDFRVQGRYEGHFKSLSYQDVVDGIIKAIEGASWLYAKNTDSPVGNEEPDWTSFYKPEQIIGKAMFLNEECVVVKEEYQGGGVCLQLMCKDGEPMATATLYIEGAQLASDEVIIKNYSENSGMLAALETAGIVEFTGRKFFCGFAEVPICRLLK